jgi:hypothetical protein
MNEWTDENFAALAALNAPRNGGIAAIKNLRSSVFICG